MKFEFWYNGPAWYFPGGTFLSSFVLYLCHMVKLRRNHSKTRAFGGRLLLLVIGASIALTWFLTSFQEVLDAPREKADLTELIVSEDPRWYLPSSTTDEVIYRDHYTLSYSENFEQAEWVAYKLTRSSLQQPNVERTDWFEADPLIKQGSAHYKDYSGSGMTRGHLVPAADMAFHEKAMEETFFMSNISPQDRAFNGGIWRELEEQVRKWTWDRGELIIVAGPVLNDGLKRIGRNEVAVPEQFYKIIFDERDKEMLAFLIPNQKSERHLKGYAVSVDTLEMITGIDFFEQSLADNDSLLEISVDLAPWEFDDTKYRLRLEKWNDQ